MKIKSMAMLAIGAGIGYVLGTPANRERFAQLRTKGKDFLGNPDVQAKTADLAEKAREKASGLPDPVQKVATTTIDAATKASKRQGSDPASGSSEGSSGNSPGGGSSSGSDNSPGGSSESTIAGPTDSPADPDEPGDRPPAAGGVPGTAPASSTDLDGDPTTGLSSDPKSDRGGPASA
jgi:hypothetical protein